MTEYHCISLNPDFSPETTQCNNMETATEGCRMNHAKNWAWFNFMQMRSEKKRRQQVWVKDSGVFFPPLGNLIPVYCFHMFIPARSSEGSRCCSVCCYRLDAFNLSESLSAFQTIKQAAEIIISKQSFRLILRQVRVQEISWKTSKLWSDWWFFFSVL